MAWMILFFLVIGFEVAAAQGNQSAVLLEQRYDRETNPRRQAGIAQDLLKIRLEHLRSAYDTGEPEPQKAALEAYRGALDRLGTAVVAARNAGASKNAEVLLRRHVRDLENLKTNVSYLDRPDIERLLQRATELRAQFLYSVMNPARS